MTYLIKHGKHNLAGVSVWKLESNRWTKSSHLKNMGVRNFIVSFQWSSFVSSDYHQDCTKDIDILERFLFFMSFQRMVMRNAWIHLGNNKFIMSCARKNIGQELNGMIKISCQKIIVLYAVWSKSSKNLLTSRAG